MSDRDDAPPGEAAILVAWAALLSRAEAERIGPTTLRVLAHEAAKAAFATAREAGDGS